MKKIPSLTIWKDHEAACVAAAYHFIFLCQQAITKNGRFTVALSGGNTPKRLYQLLSTYPFSRNIDWDKVFFFWSDERFVAPTDRESNYLMIKENLLDVVPIPAGNIFPVPILVNAKDAARKYELTIASLWKKKKIVFDCILLGLGNDGHTASLFPGTKIIKDKKRLVKEVWIEEKKSWRISFTLPLINNAATVIFLVTGKEKAEIFSSLQKKKKKLLPAQLVNPGKGDLVWITDEDASARI